MPPGQRLRAWLPTPFQIPSGICARTRLLTIPTPSGGPDRALCCGLGRFWSLHLAASRAPAVAPR